MNTYIWYDYETFGTDPRIDRIAQFAGVRTDENFNILDKIEFFCTLAKDYIPNYEAILVTKITPQDANKKGISEEKLAREIFKEFTKEGTISVGYNSLKFDDEVSRNLFYRTFRDPYVREWQNNCSRWDLMKAVLAFYMQSPEKLNWHMDNDGKPSFRLEKLSEVNGIIHEKAHDAMSDVIATVELAKKLYNADKELYDYVLSLRLKNNVKKSIGEGQVFFHVDFSYSYENNYFSILYPINSVQKNPNEVIFIDLNSDLDILIESEVEELKNLLYMKKNDLEDLGKTRPGIKVIRINQMPLLFSWNDFRHKDNLDIEFLKKQLSIAKKIEYQHGNKLAKVFEYEQSEAHANVDLDIYGAFPSVADKRQFELIHKDPKNYKPIFHNKKYNELYFRWKAKNYTDLLSEEDLERWNKHCYDTLFDLVDNFGQLSFQSFEEKIYRAKEEYKDKVEDLELILKLEKYVNQLKIEIKKNIAKNSKEENKTKKSKQKIENLKLF